jgi:hypothetical protein
MYFHPIPDIDKFFAYFDQVLMASVGYISIDEPLINFPGTHVDHPPRNCEVLAFVFTHLQSVDCLV